MFNILLALTAGILIGWNFHSFFLALDAPRILRTDINISQLYTLDTNESNVSTNSNINTSSKVSSDVNTTSLSLLKTEETLNEKFTKKTHKPIKTSFYSLLYNNLFSDAMELYQKAGYDRILFYRSTIAEYFQKENAQNQEKAIREMVEYIKIDPENGATQLFLAKVYKERKEYKKAIKVLNELIEKNTKIENEVIESALIDTSRLHIELLNKLKNYQELQTFLETQIALGSKSSFFTLALAEHHIFMDSFNKANILLKEIEFDDEYGEKAKDFLHKIEKNETHKKEYAYEIPLKKEGSHFTVEVSINDTPLTLLLDTGATLTMVNEEELPSSLTLINDNVKLKTAGGEISTQLKMAQSFKVGEIELENFKVTTSLFSQENANGLLGMNFFQKFKFKIDQEKELLYLSEK